MDADESFIAQDSAGQTSRNDDIANSLLNFATTPDELDLQSAKRQKTSRDPMSHRIIEKRRRDRMNNCLADLSRLIPTSYLKQGQGRIEKTEIIEMAIKHIKTLQAQVDGSQCQNYEPTKNTQDGGSSMDTSQLGDGTCCRERFFQGFRECQDETLRYFVEGEGLVASDPFCIRVMEHLTTVSQRFVQPYAQADEKQEVQTDLDVQQMAGSSFRSSSPMTGHGSQDSILPLPPIAGGMMVPASPIRDKHLRNLLTRHALQQLEVEREATASQNKVVSSRASDTSLTSLSLTTTASALITSPLPSGPANSVSVDSNLSCGLKNSDGSVNEGVSSGYVSDMSAMDRLSNGTGPGGDMMLSSKDSSVVNIYKFKHNITKRFSQEGKVISQQYDGGSSSTSSREADEDRHHHASVKYRSVKNKCRHTSSSDSGPYPTSDLSGATSTSSHDSVEGSHDRNKCRKLSSRSLGSSDRGTKVECCPRSAVPLPGFVLHPSGTHYMPMSVCHSIIPDMFDAGPESGVGPPVFHPISIPVHFRGPVIAVPGSSVSTGAAPCSAGKNTDCGSQHKDIKGGKKGPQ